MWCFGQQVCELRKSADALERKRHAPAFPNEHKQDGRDGERDEEEQGYGASHHYRRLFVQPQQHEHKDGKPRKGRVIAQYRKNHRRHRMSARHPHGDELVDEKQIATHSRCGHRLVGEQFCHAQREERLQRAAHERRLQHLRPRRSHDEIGGKLKGQRE